MTSVHHRLRSIERPRGIRRNSRRITPVWVAMTLLLSAVLVAFAPDAMGADPTFSFSSTTGLADGTPVELAAENLASGVTYVIVECGPDAIKIISHQRPDGDINPEDGCDAQSALVRFTGDGTSVHATFDTHVLLDAAVGSIDCRTEQCFIALFPLAGSAPLHIQNIEFGSNACVAPGSCVPGTRPGVAGFASPRPARSTPAPPIVASATSGSPATLTVTAGLAGDLTTTGAITGEVTGAFPAPVLPSSPTTGEGIIRLDLAAPGTDWGANVPSAIVANVSVDGGPTQQLVLFNGATPFVYAGGLGTLTTGSHTVTVTVNDALSHPGSGPAQIDVHDAQVLVVPPANPSYATIHFAPILWGRSTSALHDTPLIEYGSTTPSGTGTTSSYTMVFSHEDSGTAFLPFMESGVWGRLSDIETFFSVNADSAGVPTGGTFLSGNTPPNYPDTQNAISEPTVAYSSGVWDQGVHGVLRVATGNNDFSQVGTTAFRFRPVPVPAPGPGKPREAVMDTNPWTYRIVGEEVARWYTSVSDDPRLPEQGDARQYAYVQVDSSGSGVDHLAVDVQLDGDPSWYANDFGSGYDTGGTGIDRTVIKLPSDWLSHTITAVRVRVFPAAGSSLQIASIKFFGLDSNWGFHEVQLPTPQVVPGFLYSYAPLPLPLPSSTSTSISSTTPGSSPLPSSPAKGPGAARPVTATPTYTG